MTVFARFGRHAFDAERARRCRVLDRGYWLDGIDGEGLVCLGVSVNSLSRTCVDGRVVAAASGYVESGADASVAVVDAYRRAGPLGLRNLRGEYAFVVWDGEARCLFAGCDPVGLRALAYTWKDGTFLACSRALALLPLASAKWAWEGKYAAHVLAGLWCQRADNTAFQGIRRMVGGDLLRVSSAGIERLEGNRLVFRSRRIRHTGGAVRELGDRLDNIVQARADASSCISLSGGLDSCVVATALAKTTPSLTAFSLRASPGPSDPSREVVEALQNDVRHHEVSFPNSCIPLWGAFPAPDDPTSAGPVLQPGRTALLVEAKDLGFRRMFDGEGADEIFDLAWWPVDLVRDRAIRRLLGAMTSLRTAKRMARDVIAHGRGLSAELLFARVRRRLRVSRPWLRPAFWTSSSFATAWNELRSYGRLDTVPERLPDILSAHGRFWRGQNAIRGSLGMVAESPFLARDVVELVGSVHSAVAIDLRHSKALLRRLAAERVPAAIAWRPKNEALHDALVYRFISDDSNVARAADRIRSHTFLMEFVDPSAVVTASRTAQLSGALPLARALVALFAFVEWVGLVEAECGRGSWSCVPARQGAHEAFA